MSNFHFFFRHWNGVPAATRRPCATSPRSVCTGSQGNQRTEDYVSRTPRVFQGLHSHFPRYVVFEKMKKKSRKNIYSLIQNFFNQEIIFFKSINNWFGVFFRRILLIIQKIKIYPMVFRPRPSGAEIDADGDCRSEQSGRRRVCPCRLPEADGGSVRRRHAVHVDERVARWARTLQDRRDPRVPKRTEDGRSRVLAHFPGQAGRWSAGEPFLSLLLIAPIFEKILKFFKQKKNTSFLSSANFEFWRIF